MKYSVSFVAIEGIGVISLNRQLYLVLFAVIHQYKDGITKWKENLVFDHEEIVFAAESGTPINSSS
jgi:hypothetical protein